MCGMWVGYFFVVFVMMLYVYVGKFIFYCSMCVMLCILICMGDVMFVSFLFENDFVCVLCGFCGCFGFRLNGDLVWCG